MPTANASQASVGGRVAILGKGPSISQWSAALAVGFVAVIGINEAALLPGVTHAVALDTNTWVDLGELPAPIVRVSSPLVERELPVLYNRRHRMDVDFTTLWPGRDYRHRCGYSAVAAFQLAATYLRAHEVVTFGVDLFGESYGPGFAQALGYSGEAHWPRIRARLRDIVRENPGVAWTVPASALAGDVEDHGAIASIPDRMIASVCHG